MAVTAFWPLSLPQRPLEAGASFEPELNVAEASPELGCALSGPRFTVAGDYVTWSYRLTLQQLDTFRLWWRADLADGALPWNHHADPYTGVRLVVSKRVGTVPRWVPHRRVRVLLTLSLYLRP